MPESNNGGKPYYERLIAETSRQLSICNACRYCEGYCAVWDAIEYRKEFSKGDISYLSNLCHDCGECFDVCPFVPPHEFNVDIPSTLSEVRMHTYREYASPKSSAGLYERPALTASIIGLASLVSVIVFTFLSGRLNELGKAINSPGSFYVILPNLAIDVAGTFLAIFFIASWTVSGIKFLNDTSGEKMGAKSLLMALKDGLSGKWMKGGEAGCNYPQRESRGSYLKLTLHSMILYGFLLDLLATSTAFVEQRFFGILPPYPLLSVPVVTGISGGILIIAGVSMFLYHDHHGTSPKKGDMKLLDRVFMLSLLLTAATGLALLALRSTSLMGGLLLIHVSVVSTLFITAPYGKFVHLVYRGLSTAKYHDEKARFDVQ